MKEIRMQAGITRNFYILDPITADGKRYNYMTGQEELVESKTSQRYFVDNLAGLGPADAVNLYINCNGGSVKEALGIYSVLQRCPATVTAYIDGFACSAASVIAMAAQKVIMPRNTAMMIHNAAGYAYGNAKDLRKAADDLDVINRAAIQSYTMHAGDKLPEDELQRMLDAETWLVAEDCVKWGLADELGSGEVDPDAALAQYTAAAAQAAANDFDARLFENPPAFLADRYRPPEAKAEEEPKSNSCIYQLLKNMTM
ncbi:MAG: head maturation protease, ClpP-related [Faecousia sp.]